MIRLRIEKTEPDRTFIERKILIGLVTSTDYIQQIRSIYQPRFLVSPMAKKLAGWCIEYYDTYKSAIGKNIEGLYFDKFKGLPKDIGEEIGEILNGLSTEYEKEGLDQFLVDSTLKYFEQRNNEILVERLQEAMNAGEVDTFNSLLTEYKPIHTNIITTAKGCNGLELYNMDMKPVEWLITDLIPKGLTLFGGHSKLGKSFLMLNMVTRLAQKKPIFSNDPDTGYRGPRGSILYLALEDPQSRLRHRLKEIEPDPNTGIEKIHFEPEWKHLRKGGLTDLESWIKSVKDLKLIVIDVIAKVWDIKATTGGGRQYAEEYNNFSPLADLAHKYNISIIAITHTKKSPEIDAFNEILGGSGTYGSADNLMLLSRAPNNQRKLSIRGKDIEEKHLLFNVIDGAEWICLGEAEEVQKSTERQSLYDYLMVSGPKERHEIVQAAEKGLIEIKASSIPVILRKMVNDGKLIQDGRYGKYSASGYINVGIAEKLGRNKRISP